MGTLGKEAAGQARPAPWGGAPPFGGGRGGLQAKLAVPLVQLHPSWRKVGERVPRPRGWRHRSPGHTLSPRAGRARLVRPQPMLPAAPAACAAGNCQLLVRKSTRHILASRGMQGGGAPGRSSELGVHLGAREGRFRDGLDSGKRLERKGALLARWLAFPAPEIRKVAGAQSLFIFRCVCESTCVCARAGIFQVGICFCPSLAKGESSVENLCRGQSRSRGVARAWRPPREPCPAGSRVPRNAPGHGGEKKGFLPLLSEGFPPATSSVER